MNTSVANSIARKILASKVLDKPEIYTFAELCNIRDACRTLAKYKLEDKALLNETLKYLALKVGE